LNDYGASALYLPYLFAAIYDSRIPLDIAIDCGLVGLTEIPALGSNSFTILASRTTDRLGMMEPPPEPAGCMKLYTDTFTMSGPPYTSYDFHLSSTGVHDPSSCDADISANNTCFSQAIIRYGTHSVTTRESAPGIEKIQILTDEGAIVGAVQFFLYFLGVFSMTE
jgi:hypothetical protein